MEKAFSNKWKSSKQPRKQRKFRHNAPENVKTKFMRANLAKELRAKYSKRSIRIRTGDKVKIVRGQFKGREGKIDRVDTYKLKIYLEKIEISKKDGSKALFPLDPTNVTVTELVEDKKRVSVGEKK